MNRKQFIKNTTLTAASVALMPATNLFARDTKEKVKLIMIGTGIRGQNNLDLFCGERMWSWLPSAILMTECFPGQKK